MEHVLNNINTVIGAIKDKHDPWQTLFEVQLPLFFGKANISWWKAIFSKWLVIVVTFSWSFMDLFVIIVSVGLASLFKRLNADLKQIKNQVNSVRFFISSSLTNLDFPLLALRVQLTSCGSCVIAFNIVK